MNGNTGPQGSLDNDSVAQAILQYQNTPIQGIGLSLVQLLLHCRIRDSIPSQPILYKSLPKWVAVAQHHKEILHHCNVNIVERYNRYTHNLSPLQAGDTVAIQSPHNATLQDKSLLSYQITNTKSGLMDQEESHLGIAVSWESAKSSLHQPQYWV